MPEHNLFRIFVSRLNTLSISYMITGAVASTVYGEPRLTNDIDLVVDMSTDDGDAFTDEASLKALTGHCKYPVIFFIRN